MPIKPPWFLRKRNPGPEYYRMSCTQCDFKKTVELAKNYTVITNPDCSDPEAPEIAEELPEICPKCGAKLRKEKMTVKIRY